MKVTFTSVSKSQAEDFQKYIKTDRNLDSEIKEQGGQFFVEYSVADYAAPAPADPCEYVKIQDFQDTLSRLAAYLFEELRYQTAYLSRRLDYLSDAFYDHTSVGHLPKINGAGKMQKAMDALGISEDYQVLKPAVFASTSYANRGPSLDLDFPAK
jgi:hypothetical protein